MADKIYVTNGCSNHCKDEREQNDFYATNPKIVEKLFTECKIDFSKNILEPCAKNGDEELFGSGAVAYAWIEWEKGANCKPLITWINGDEKPEKWSFMDKKEPRIHLGRAKCK